MELTQAELKELLQLDPETGEFTRIGPWYVKGLGEIAGTLNLYGYVDISIYGKIYKRSRLVWLYVHGAFPRNQIDHINGIRNDDRPENIREATDGENKENIRKPYKNNQTGFQGVVRRRTEFVAQIWVKKKLIYLGQYDTAPEASEVYLAAKRKYHLFCTI